MDESETARSVWSRLSSRVFGQQGAKIWGIFGLLLAICVYTAASSNQCLVGVLLPYLLTHHEWPIGAAVLAVLTLAVLIGLIHGLLVTKLRLQPFVVTLCGLLLYRGIARGITGDTTQGFRSGFQGLRQIATKHLPIFGDGENVFHLPATTLMLIIIAVVAAIFLNKTIY